ncbi:cytochrome C oxidase subunit IV family protein [Pseudomonas typographi]|uniref:cytochrome C oxidase subunit IV family protein n=1 Tax=Pseudomonas typographi TaxID=2715964 RepID=UPI0016888456|nr:cytochrome-c oxidase [Pseudomonas typographi]MBD1589566.1 cytochrome-c oxidase [Pseudomonas typographi]
MNDVAAYRRTLRLYTLGLVLAVLLTAVPFAVVGLTALNGPGLWWVLYGCGALQVMVHFRCFLHISLARSHRHDLWLLLFSGLIIALMVGGTFWVLLSQMARMGG